MPYALHRRWRSFVHVLGLFLGFVFSAHGAPVSEQVSLDEFRALVQESVSKIPELREIWAWNAEHGEKKSVYLGGGALRGLLKLLRERLTAHSLSEVKSMPIPPVAKLMIQDQSDLDFLALSAATERLHHDLPETRNWDMLSEHFYHDSVKSGGVTLEKLFVSPEGMVDPFHALTDFYHGKLAFRPVSLEHLNHRWIQNNSYTVQALRFLRMYYDIGGLTIDQSTFARLRELVGTEAKRRQNASGGSLWRVRKAVKKLYVALGSDPRRLQAVLRPLELTSLMDLHAVAMTCAEGYESVQRADLP